MARHDEPVPKLFWVPAPFPGRLAVAERPRGGDWLAADLARFRAEGVDTLVSALAGGEVRECWLEEAPAAAEACGLAFLHLPTPNLLTLPVDEALPVFEELAAQVRAGRGVAVHCHASVGRAPTIVTSVLALLGLDPADAWARVEAVRGKRVPDTNIQRDWVDELLAHRDNVREPPRTESLP